MCILSIVMPKYLSFVENVAVSHSRFDIKFALPPFIQCNVDIKYFPTIQLWIWCGLPEICNNPVIVTSKNNDWNLNKGNPACAVFLKSLEQLVTTAVAKTLHPRNKSCIYSGLNSWQYLLQPRCSLVPFLHPLYFYQVLSKEPSISFKVQKPMYFYGIVLISIN